MKRWLGGIALAVALALAAARCDKDVDLGADPLPDGGLDGGDTTDATRAD